MNQEALNERLKSAGQEKQSSVQLALLAMTGAVQTSQQQLKNVAENFANDTRTETQKARESLEKITDKTREDQAEQLKQLRQELVAIQKKAQEDLAAERAKTARMFRWAIPAILLVIALTAAGTYYSASSQTTSVANRALAKLDSATADKVAVAQVQLSGLQEQSKALQAKIEQQQKAFDELGIATHLDKDGAVWAEIPSCPPGTKLEDILYVWNPNKHNVVKLLTTPQTKPSAP